MADKGSLYAFVVGEVSPAFYGRADLAKHPLALAESENFFVDYKGGIFSRPGTEFVGVLPDASDCQLVRFRASSDDYLLVFTPNKMRVVRNGGYLLTGESQTLTFNSAGTAVSAYPYAVGRLMFAEGYGYVTVSAVSGSNITLKNFLEEPLVGTYRVEPVYELATGIADPSAQNYFQDLHRVVITSQAHLPVEVTYVSDTNWTIANVVENIPDRPTGVTGVASGTGTASVIYTVTAVVNDVESNAATKCVLTGIVNFAVTAGEVKLSWTGVTGAEHYNVYRSIVYPTGASDTLDQLGYIGRTTGLTFVDPNRTPDFTKTPPKRVNFFSDSNYPALYARFQQRGIYAGLVSDPLSVVGSNNQERMAFRVNSPPIATDAFKYTLDSESVRPIKHMLPLRSSLLLFTSDTISQLTGGGDSKALTAVSASAETQGYVSVSDVRPVAINLDVLFLTGLFSEMNAMLYTEYTNSFQTRDVMALSSHMLGENLRALEMDWVAEPHKLLTIVREDGQLVHLTYDRLQEVFGWSRSKTKGKFLKFVSIREGNYSTPYMLVERQIGGKTVTMLERQKPRVAGNVKKQWYVDCGLENNLQGGTMVATLRRVSGTSWQLVTPTTLTFPEGQIGVYALDGFFIVESQSGSTTNLKALVEPTWDTYYCKGEVALSQEDWRFGVYTDTVSGLWHLEGEKVSVQVDGDSYIDLQVVDGQVTVPQPGVRFVVGLGYRARAKTLPLSLGTAVFEGRPVAIRKLCIRVLETKGLELGPGYDDLQMIPARRDELWGERLGLQSDMIVQDLLGGHGWENYVTLCFEQKYPLPAAILGLVYDLDIGE